jgi:hypothetical protein
MYEVLHFEHVTLYIPVYSYLLVVCVPLNMVSMLFVLNAIFMYFNTFEIIRM